MQLVYKQYEIVKNTVSSELQKKKESSMRFSLSLDEYTSLQNRRLMNISFYYLGGFINLGMIALKGKIDAENINQIIQLKPEEFKLSYTDDSLFQIGPWVTGSWVMGHLGHINRWVRWVMGHNLLTQ